MCTIRTILWGGSRNSAGGPHQGEVGRVGGRGGTALRAGLQMRATSSAQIASEAISKSVSKKCGHLEIHLEIVEGLPGKDFPRFRAFISKSPAVFILAPLAVGAEMQR